MAIVVVSAALVLAIAVLIVWRPDRGLTPSPGATAAAAVLGPLALSTTNPPANSTNVPPGDVVTVSFSAPLASGSPVPTRPRRHVAGNWDHGLPPTSMAFTLTGWASTGGPSAAASPAVRPGW